VVAAALVLLIRFVVPVAFPEADLYGVIGGIVGAMAVFAWWLFFSRAAWLDRLGAIALMVAGVAAVSRVVHPSIAGGMMGMMLPLYSIPVLSIALAAALVASRNLSNARRRAAMAVCILLACGAFALLRTDGVIGAGSQITWRWSPTAEERLLSRASDEPEPIAPAPAIVEHAEEEAASATPAPVAGETHEEPVAVPSIPVVTRAAEWPGFRGTNRDGVVHGVRIQTDWSQSPPVNMWRRAIGPGWSSFAVDGDLLYTQEQRGDDEIVSAYRVSTGEPVWRHRDGVRFWESNGGAGPRGTPTLSNGRVYSFGATGVLNALDERTGAVIWSRNVATDSDTEVPMWGFSSSPLVVGDVVIVAAAGKLVGYEIATGKKRWVGDAHGASYSSPHRSTIDGVTQILLLSAEGATSVAPETGAVLWQHEWSGSAIVQPAITADGGVLINTLAATGGLGTRRLNVTHEDGAWNVAELWTSTGLKPYFNDFVVHKGFAYGFDGNILSCINLEDGKRVWKGGRYGGQLVLLPEQDLLLVLSEEGELALVSATPDQFKEVARAPAIEGKTWNHPALIGDILLVRNGEEMAAFRLPLASH
jgi:outer membrane protein assembly factor BamB